MATKVLLVSSIGWPSVARLAGGFAQAGMTVEAMAPPGAVIIASRYLARWHRYRALRPLASLDRAIAASAPDLISCCDDRAVAQVLALYGRSRDGSPLRELVERSLGNPGVYARLISRDGFVTEARSLGIRTPDTMRVADGNDLDCALFEFGLPLVLKADGSWGGEGVVVARNAEAARAAFAKLSRPPSALRSVARAAKRRDAHFLLDAFAAAPRRVSAQRFIVGHSAASAFAAWHGKLIGEICYDVVVSDGDFGPPNVIRRVDCPELSEASQKVAKHFGLSGIHGMDFIRDAQGRTHLIEINPRATQGSTLAFGRGADLPAALAAQFVADAGVRPAIPTDRVALFPRVWLRDPLSPHLATTYHDVPWDDPQVLFASLGIAPDRLKGVRLPRVSPTLPSPMPKRAFARLFARSR